MPHVILRTLSDNTPPRVEIIPEYNVPGNAVSLGIGVNQLPEYITGTESIVNEYKRRYDLWKLPKVQG